MRGSGALRLVRRLALIVIAIEVGGIASTLVRRAAAVLGVGVGVGALMLLFLGVRRVHPRLRGDRSFNATTTPAADDLSAEPISLELPASRVLQDVGKSLTRVLVGSDVTAVPMAVHLGSALLELFWSDCPPGPRNPWALAPSGWVWNGRRGDIEAHVMSGGGVCDDALPACVRVGGTRRGELALNVEAWGKVSLGGDAGERAGFASLLMAELGDRGAEVIHVTNTPATPPPDGSATRAANYTCSAGAALARARACAGERRTMLEERAWPSAFVARLHDPEPARWRPLVLFLDEIEGGDDLLSLGSAALAITCVVSGACRAADLELEVHAGMLRVPFLGAIEITVGASRTSEAPEREVDPHDAPAPDADGAASESDSPVALGLELDDRDGIEREPAGVEVLLLGPVQVRGASGGGELTGKSIELIAYLACNPEGAADDRIQAALWPERSPSPKTWRNRVWSARQALGAGPDGESMLPHFEGRVGRLGPGVRTDVEELVDALAASAELAPADAISVLRDALTLVRGRPFEEANGYEWAFADMHVTHAECVVADVAHRLVELALDAGDPGLALWATDRALRCCPANEPLSLDRMRAFHAAGDLAGVETTMRDLLASLDADEPEGVLHDDTIAAYQALLPERSGPRDRRRPHADPTS